MKKLNLNLILLLCFIFSIQIVNAQQTVEPEYLIDLKKVKLSGFGNTHSEFSVMDGEYAYSSGSGGAFLFDYKYFLGIYNQDIQSKHLREDIYPTEHNPDTNPMDPKFVCNRIRFHHGGIWMGYIHKPNNLWHLGTNLRLGTGKIGLFDKDLEFSAFDEHHSDWVAVVTPEMDIELNIARWFKIGMSLGYRQVIGVDKDLYTNIDGESKRLFESGQFSSPVASIKLHFGSFGPRLNGRNRKNRTIDHD